MKSKATYIKIGKEVMKGQRWLLLLNILMLFCLYPVFFVALLIRIENREREHITEFFNTIMFHNDNLATMGRVSLLLALFLGIVAGVSEYAFSHNRAKTDLLYSLPIGRTQLLGIKTIVAVSGYIVSVILSIGMVFLIAIIRQVITSSGVEDFLQVMLVGVLAYLLGFFLGIVVTQLTGKMYVAILGVVTFLGIGIGVWIAVLYYSGLYYPNVELSESFTKVLENLSPLGLTLLIDLENSMDLLWLLGSVVILAILSYYLVNKRPVERIGKSMIYQKVAIVVEVVMGVMVALLTSMFITAIIYAQTPTETMAWSVVGALLGAIISYVITEFIYGTSLVKLLKNTWKGVAMGGVAIGMIVFMNHDVTEVNETIPKYEEIQDINIAFLEYAMVMSGAEFEGVHMGKSEEVYELIEIIANANAQKVEDAGFISGDMTVEFVMDNGEKIQRVYGVGGIEEVLYSKYGENISVLWENEKFLDFNYKLRNSSVEEQVTDEYFQAVEVTCGSITEGLWGTNTHLLSPYESEEFLQILSEEYKKMDGQRLLEEGIIGYASVIYDQYEPNQIASNIPIFQSFDKAIAYMKEYDGLGFAYAKERVEEVVIGEQSYTTKEEIDQICNDLIYEDLIDFRVGLNADSENAEYGYVVINGRKVQVFHYE